MGDEIPCNQEFLNQIRSEAAKVVGEKAAAIINITVDSPVRDSRFDPAMTGAAKYLLDTSIQSFMI